MVESSQLDDGPAPVELSPAQLVVADDVGPISVMGAYIFFPLYVNECIDGVLLRPIVVRVRLPVEVVPGVIHRTWLALAGAGLRHLLTAVRPRLLS